MSNSKNVCIAIWAILVMSAVMAIGIGLLHPAVPRHRGFRRTDCYISSKTLLYCCTSSQKDCNGTCSPSQSQSDICQCTSSYEKVLLELEFSANGTNVTTTLAVCESSGSRCNRLYNRFITNSTIVCFYKKDQNDYSIYITFPGTHAWRIFLFTFLLALLICCLVAIIILEIRKSRRRPLLKGNRSVNSIKYSELLPKPAFI